MVRVVAVTMACGYFPDPVPVTLSEYNGLCSMRQEKRCRCYRAPAIMLAVKRDPMGVPDSKIQVESVATTAHAPFLSYLYLWVR